MKKERSLGDRKKRIALANAGIQTFIYNLQAQGLWVRLRFSYMLIFRRFKRVTVQARDEGKVGG